MTAPTLTLGSPVLGASGQPYTVTPLDLDVLARLYALGGTLARRQTVWTYGEAAAVLGVVAVGMGRYLDLLTAECTARGEVTTAALFVSRSTGLPSDPTGLPSVHDTFAAYAGSAA